MGNQQVFINYVSGLVFVQDLNDQLLEQGSQRHPSLGLIKLWQIKKDPKCQLFSLVISTSILDSQLLQIHQQRCQMQHPNLLKYYACSKSIEVGSVQKQQYFFEYHSKTLKQITMKAPLQEEYIWTLVEQIVNVMEYLQKLNKFHGNLTSESIFIDNQNNVKLLDNLNQKRYNKNSISEDIFQLGLLCLEMMTQRSSQLNFNNALKQLIGKYSLQFLQLTKKLLQKDVDIFLDFVELKNILNNRFQIPITINQAKIIKTEQGYSSCSSVQIFDIEEIARIKQMISQNQKQIGTINYSQNQQVKQNYLLKVKQLNTIPQKLQTEPDLIKSIPNKWISLNFYKDQSQSFHNNYLSNNNHALINQNKRYSLQLQQQSQVINKRQMPNDGIMYQQIKQPQQIGQKQQIKQSQYIGQIQQKGQLQKKPIDMKQSLELLDKIFKNLKTEQSNQTQKFDMFSSIDSSHSTQFYFSQNKRQQKFYNSAIQTPCHRNIQSCSFRSIHKKSEN